MIDKKKEKSNLLQGLFEDSKLNYWNKYRVQLIAELIGENKNYLNGLTIEDEEVNRFMMMLFKADSLVCHTQFSLVTTQNQQLYINFLLHLINPNLIDIKTKVHLGKQIAELEVAVISEFTQLLKVSLEEYDNIFDPNGVDTDHNLFLYHCYFMVIQHKLYGANLVNYFRPLKRSKIYPGLAAQKLIIQQKLQVKAEDILSAPAYQIFRSNQDFFTTELSNHLRSKEDIVKINIEYLFAPSEIPILKNKILTFLNGEKIKFVTNPKESDLIISDSC